MFSAQEWQSTIDSRIASYLFRAVVPEDDLFFGRSSTLTSILQAIENVALDLGIGEEGKGLRQTGFYHVCRRECLAT
jgi:hypothetical protein